MHGLSRHDPTGLRTALACAAGMALVLAVSACTLTRSTVETTVGEGDEARPVKMTNLRSNILRRGTFTTATAIDPESGQVVNVQTGCDEGVSGKAAFGGVLAGSVFTGTPLGALLGGLAGAISDVFGGEDEPLCQEGSGGSGEPETGAPDGPVTGDLGEGEG